MAEAVKVEITDDTGKATISAAAPSSTSNGNNASLNQNSKENNKKSNAAVVAKMVAMRSVSYATSNIGKWTGNSRNQNMMNTAKQTIGYGMALASNPWLGMAVIAMDGITNMIDYAWEMNKDKNRVNQVNARTGGKGGYRK